ncbi:MAG: hypothetical protein EOO63_18290, partial [Hymenobacter sp.]
MRKQIMIKLWLALTTGCLLTWSARAQTAGEERVAITSISPSIDTGQDYSPWLNDDPSNLVQNGWMPANFQYIDVTLKLAKPTAISRLSLFD